MSEKEKRITEKIASGLDSMPDQAFEQFMFGASCYKMGRADEAAEAAKRADKKGGPDEPGETGLPRHDA